MAGLQLDQLRAALQNVETSAQALEQPRAGTEQVASATVREQAKRAGLLPDGAEAEASSTDPEQDLQLVQLAELQALHDDLKGQAQAKPSFFGAHGCGLYAGLADIVASCDGPAPLGREQRMLRQAMNKHVSGVFGELEADSEGRTRLMDNYRANIDGHMERVRRISDELSSEEILPSRIDKEHQRAKLVCELSEMHTERARSVSEPSRVPGLLREKLQEFEAEQAGRLGELERLQQKHERLALQARGLVGRQQAYKESVVQRCLEEEEVALKREERSRAQAHQGLALILETARRVCGHLEEAQRARDEAAERVEERRATEAQLDEGMGFQKRIEAGNLALTQRFARGKGVVQAFGSWLGGAYAWMERTMGEQRAALEVQMPEERENFQALLCELAADAGRRREDLQWAMAQVAQKRDKKLEEAKSQEQVRSQRAKERVASMKRELRETDEELEAMQREYEELGALQQRIQRECLDRLGARDAALAGQKKPQHSARAFDWVRSFFHNRGPPQKRYVPAALQDLRRSLEDQRAAQQLLQQQQQPGFLLCIRRRISGKRPGYQSECPAPKRQRQRLQLQ